MNKIETPFDPFRNEEGKVELQFDMTMIVSRIGQHITNIIGDEKLKEELMAINIPTESPHYHFYVEASDYGQLQKALSPFPNLSSDARNEIILFSLLPRYYEEVFNQKTKNFLQEFISLYEMMALKHSTEANLVNNAEVILPQTRHTKRSPVKAKHVYKHLSFSPEMINAFDILKNVIEKKSEKQDIDIEFLRSLNGMSQAIKFIQKSLPSKSSFRNLIIVHLYFIFKAEGLFSNINPNNNTDIRITKLIIVLFEAVGHFEVLSAEEQIKKVNKAYSKESILIVKRIKKLLS